METRFLPINKETIQEFQNTERKLYASEKHRDIRKTFYIYLNANYEIVVNKEIVYHGNDIEEAVRVYNSY